MTTVALIAAKDSAASIGYTVGALTNTEGVDEVWVVDDGSSDQTAKVAADAGAQVIRLERNRGKGGALACGVAATPHASAYLLADGDLAGTAHGLASLLQSDAQLTVGVLPSAGGRGGFGSVKKLARAGIARATGVECDAPLSGQRLVEADLLRSLTFAPRFGVEVGMTIDALRQGATFAELPVAVDHDHRGRSLAGFAHRGRQGADVIAVLVPRLVSKRAQVAAVLVVASLVLGALLGLSAATRPASGAPLPSADRVVLVAIEGVGLDDARGEVFAPMGRQGLLGALSVRTSDRRATAQSSAGETPRASDGYASLGASARVRWMGDMARSRAHAAHDDADALPGALGDALASAGLTTATSRRGEAAAAIADRRGTVGDAADADVTLVTADRASAAGTIQRVLDTRGDATVIAFGITPPGSEWELTPVAIVGKGIAAGTVASPTTRRASLAGLVDIGPTVLQVLGAPVPAAMTGEPMRRVTAAPAFAALERQQDDGATRLRFFLPAGVGYTVVALAFYVVLALLVLTRVARSATSLLRFLVCAVGSFPLGTLVVGGLEHWAGVGGDSPVALVGACVVSALLVHRIRGVGPAHAISTVTLAVLVVDVAARGPLQTASILGYSIQTTGRYYGLPNASFAVFAACLLLVAGAVAGWKPSAVRIAAALSVLTMGILFVALPGLGGDVGGTITLVPLSALALWGWLGRPVDRRVLMMGVAVVAATVAVLLGLQLIGDGTHLGRLVSGDTNLAASMRRRVRANLGLLVDQWWGFLSLGLGAAIAAALATRDRFVHYLPSASGLRVAAFVAAAASLVGFAVNDSGPVVNVLVLVALAPALALNVLAGPFTIKSDAERS